MAGNKKTVIIGLGNPFLKDDGVGVRVAELLEDRFAKVPSLSIQKVSAGGLRLMEVMTGFERAIIIDALKTGCQPPGTIKRLDLDELGLSLHTSSSHDTSLACALRSGKQLGLVLPEEIMVWGIEAEEVHTFGEEMSRAVAEAVPVVVKAIEKEIANTERKELCREQKGMVFACTNGIEEFQEENG
jgi:hydrogenase maturation protease